MPIIELESVNINYAVIRHPRRRHVYLEVRPGYVILRVPQRFASRRVPDILCGQAGWIKQQLALLEEVVAPTRRQYVTGERFPYLGKTHALKVVYSKDATKPFVKLRGGFLWVSTAMPACDGGGQSAVRDAILGWYRSRANEYLPERVEKLRKNMGIRPARVAVKRQATRWGSCSSGGSVNLNWRLILAPTRVADYVIAHELCHLKVADHSKRFWKLLAAIDPEFSECRQWLKANTWRLRLWLYDAEPPG
jgi:hypothetical protein